MIRLMTDVVEQVPDVSGHVSFAAFSALYLSVTAAWLWLLNLVFV
ncbi:hypothetical protein [Oceanibacterium hippocampi]|nr:hypothetical protein [Oceanibacterium hippocampi]